MAKLTNKVTVVTGASKGIGTALGLLSALPEAMRSGASRTTALRRTVVVLFLLAIAPGLALGDPSRTALAFTLTPRLVGPAAGRLDVLMQVTGHRFAEGDILLRMPLETVSIPTARYTTRDIEVQDNHGPVGLRQVDEEPGKVSTFRHWVALRATSGTVRIRYSAVPRKVDGTTRNGPIYDLRAESGGLTGTGIYFLALPPADEDFVVTMRWDLQSTPKATRAVWSLGDGRVPQKVSSDSLMRSYFMVGDIRSMPTDPGEGFGVFWLTDPPFPIRDLSERLARIYKTMSRFFNDEGSRYRVFVRFNPFPGHGGTAFDHAFVFAYQQGVSLDLDDEVDILAHEIAHTWPSMQGDIRDVAWFNEGTAEYYDLVLSLKAGVLDEPHFIERINARTDAYYASPYRSLTNWAAGDLAWTNGDAQRIPYQRGFLYLAMVDGQLRAATGGKLGLDDLVMDMVRKARVGDVPTIASWRDTIRRYLGKNGLREFDAMTRGGELAPVPGAFGGCYSPYPITVRPYELGFDANQLGTVSRLKNDSAASKAGAREGDLITSISSLDEPKLHPEREIEMTIVRDGAPIKLRFKPQGEPVRSYHWKHSECPNKQTNYISTAERGDPEDGR